MAACILVSAAGCGDARRATQKPNAATSTAQPDVAGQSAPTEDDAGSAGAAGRDIPPSNDAGAAGSAHEAGGSAMSAGSAGVHRAGTGGAAGAGKPSTGNVCKPGEFKCVDDMVYRCNDARSDFIKDSNIQRPCGAGLCNSQLGKCNICKPRAVACGSAGDATVTCSDDGQSMSSNRCSSTSPYCSEGVCSECKPDSDPRATGCAPGNDCVRSGDQRVCMPSEGAAPGMKVQFCHAGACKVTLAPGFDLDLKADWRACTGAANQQPFGADTVGIMLWPTAMTDLVIPLADSGWFCKLPPTNGNTNGCIVNASQSVRDLYIWGPIETSCTYVWGDTPNGIDAAAGPGCGMCMFTEHAADTSADYAFNLGFDASCRCPKLHFAAVPAKKL